VVIVPLQENPHDIYRCLVKAKDEVVAGQKIGERGDPPFVLSVHASISGKVREIGALPSPHGHDLISVVIESDGKTNGCVKLASVRGNIETLLDAGVSLEYEKLSGQKVEVLLVNATEFDPYMTVRHQILHEKPALVIEGLKTVMDSFSVPRALLCVEHNQVSSIKALKDAARAAPGINVQPLPKACPPSAEAVLLRGALKQRETVDPNRVASIDVSHLVAVSDAVTQGLPFIERPITVAGSGVSSPQNIRVRIGTPFDEVLTHCGGDVERITQLVMGGGLMGISQHSTSVPVTQKTVGILAMITFPLAEGHHSKIYKRGDCVRCAKCVDCCPVSILPNLIAACCESKRFEEAVQKGLFVCVDCGLCSYVCPARIPLSHIIKTAKSRGDLLALASPPGVM
jgi:electron transport complex protein RnfC